MAATVKRVRDLLAANFHNADVAGIQDERGRVIGSFTTTDFDGLPFQDRLARVNELIRRGLGADAMNIGVIMPLDGQGKF